MTATGEFHVFISSDIVSMWRLSFFRSVFADRIDDDDADDSHRFRWMDFCRASKTRRSPARGDRPMRREWSLHCFATISCIVTGSQLQRLETCAFRQWHAHQHRMCVSFDDWLVQNESLSFALCKCINRPSVNRLRFSQRSCCSGVIERAAHSSPRLQFSALVTSFETKAAHTVSDDDGLHACSRMQQRQSNSIALACHRINLNNTHTATHCIRWTRLRSPKTGCKVIAKRIAVSVLGPGRGQCGTITWDNATFCYCRLQLTGGSRQSTKCTLMAGSDAISSLPSS